jgi:hypothetical protein
MATKMPNVVIEDRFMVVLSSCGDERRSRLKRQSTLAESNVPIFDIADVSLSHLLLPGQEVSIKKR